MLDASPEELDRHRLGLAIARQKRLQRITQGTAGLLAQMEETIEKANSKVLLNPFDSPAAVRSSERVATELRNFRSRLGIESGHQASEAKRWGQAASEVRDKVAMTTAEGVDAALRLGARTLDQAAEALHAVDPLGDGIPNKQRAFSAMEDAGSALGGLVVGAAGTVGSLLRRKPGAAPSPKDLDSETVDQEPESPDA